MSKELTAPSTIDIPCSIFVIRPVLRMGKEVFFLRVSAPPREQTRLAKRLA